jgi:hypothetical protein
LRESARLAYKAYEIEELVDVYFFRRLGVLVAHAARLGRLTPNQVSVVAAIAGVAGGALLFHPRTALAGFGLLILHGVIDSADGQLARMTNRTSEIGRVLDGISGYVTHAAIFLAIALGEIDRGAGWGTLAVAALAGGCTAIQAQLYDYHRNSYAEVAVKGLAPAAPGREPADDRRPRTGLFRLLAVYEWTQRRVAGLHPEVEAAIAGRSEGGRVRPEDRDRYRALFYRPVRGWNLLGDNVRRYAVGLLVTAQRLDWFFGFILLPMNAVAAAMWWWQRRADRRFLAAVRAGR